MNLMVQGVLVPHGTRSHYVKEASIVSENYGGEERSDGRPY